MARLAAVEGDVAPDVHRLPAVVPFPVPPANTTFVDGEVPTLFDTGPYTHEGWEDLQRHAKAKGIDLAKVERVVLTHSHLDHAGNAHRMRELSGCEVWIHEAEAEDLRTWGRFSEERNDSYDAGLRRAGLPLPMLEKLAKSGREVDVLLEACEVDRELKGGESFQAGDRTFHVLHTPGHTAGSCVFVTDDANLSVTGDTILERITPNALSVRKEETGALGRYMDTLRKLRETELGVMVPGHGKPFTDIGSVVDRAFSLFQRRHDRIRAYLKESRHPRSVWDIVQNEWPEGQKGQAFLMTSEILGHLDILVADGEVQVTEPEERDDGGETALYQVPA